MPKHTIGIQVTIEESQLERLRAQSENSPGLNDVQLLSGMATGLLQDMADGAALIEPAHAAEVTKLLGSTDGTLIVQAVERGMDRDGDAFIARWRIDPVYMPALEQLAEMRGIGVNELIQEGMSWVMDQNWLFQLDSDVEKLRLDRDQFNWLKEVLSKECPTGADVIEHLKQYTENPLMDERPVAVEATA